MSSRLDDQDSCSDFSRYATWHLAVLPPPLDEDHVEQAPRRGESLAA
jgi:hypothetical protein